MDSFKTLLVEDARISDLTSDLGYAVESGAASVTYQQFGAISQSASQITFQIQCPNENVIIDRAVRIQSTLAISVAIAGVTAGALAFNYGQNDSLQAFPLASLMLTLQAQINNTSVSVNLQDILPQILRLNDNRELLRYNSTTPALTDCGYASFSNAALTNNNPLAGYSNSSYDIDFVPRGAFPYLPGSFSVLHYNAVTQTYDSLLTSAGVNDTWVVGFQVNVIEPLFLSPFTFSNPQHDAQGIFGINNFSVVANLDSTCKRLLSTASQATTYTPTLGYTPYATIPVGTTTANLANYRGTTVQPITSSFLNLCFLSPQPSQSMHLSSRNSCPYIDYPRYISSAQNSGTVAAGATTTITSSNIQINQCPDSFIICVRIPMATQTVKNPSSFFSINNISINFNNKSGILSSANKSDLFHISLANGCNQSWSEWSGIQNTANNATGTGSSVYTTGSLLVLSPVFNFGLENSLSSGSLGNYNFQFTINVTNTTTVACVPEIVVLCANSGIFQTNQGMSAAFTGLLTKETVLKTVAQDEYISSNHYDRQIGGNMLNAIKSAAKHFQRRRRHIRGAGTSGGGTSGGGTSGGSKLNKYLV
jgi:hypothetical protein